MKKKKILRKMTAMSIALASVAMDFADLKREWKRALAENKTNVPPPRILARITDSLIKTSAILSEAAYRLVKESARSRHGKTSPRSEEAEESW
jgi:hypothetical protein